MRKLGAIILGIIFGLMFTIGLYVYLVEAGGFDPASKLGLVFPIAGVLLGIVAGAKGGWRKRKGTI
jgi:hypothetical protein